MRQRALPGGYPLDFYLAFLANFLFFSSMHLLITPLPLYIQELGGGAPQVGLAMTSFALAAIVTRPYMGRLVDSWGRKPVMLIGSTLFVLGPLSYTLAHSVPALLAARMFHGVGIAAFTTAYFALVVDVTPRSRWGEALGVAGTAPSVSMILASPVGTTLTHRLSFPAIFVAAGLTALLSLAIILLLHEPERKSAARQAANPDQRGLLDVVKVPGVLVPSLATVTLGLSYGAVYTFLPLFAVSRGLGNVGFFFTVLGLVAILSRSFAGRLSDKVGRVAVILPMFIVFAVAMLGLNWTYSFVMLMVMALATGIGFGGTSVGLDAMVVDNAPSGARGTALSLVYFCFDSGIAIGTMVIGIVAVSVGYGHVYLLVGAACILTAIAFGAAMRNQAAA